MSTTTLLMMLSMTSQPHGAWTAPLTFAAPAASEQEVAPLGQSDEQSASLSVEGGWAWQLRTDLTDTAAGRFTHDRGHLRVRGRVPLRDDLELLLGARQQRDNFGFSDMVAPWSSINTTQFDAALQWQATERWQIYGGGMARWAAEQGGSLGDGFEGGGAIGGAYAFSKDLILGGGVGVQTQIEDDLLVYPIIVAEWKIAERLRLSTQLTTGWANQTGGEVVYAASDTVDIGVSAVFDYQRFRLSDDAPVAGGAGVTEALPVSFFVSIDLGPQARVTAFIGINAYGRLKTTDSASNDVWASDHDPAPVLGVQGTIRF
ncbi:MAG: hypothetical protein QGG74_03495 [Phycisphaerales bacterium]|jgi:hypothetical protein|nr:hypothetical protein [Phycisphaerales bacterium]